MRHAPTDAESKLWLFLRDRRLGHAKDEKIAADSRRTASLAGRRIRLLRFWNDQALRETDTVLELILKALEGEEVRPSPPTPLPSRERGVAGPSPKSLPLSLKSRG
jgi:very-short-patch-repair endonuclease